MKVVGFTFIRNALQYDYPILEAIQSILPLCEEVVVAIGQSEDDTLGLIKSLPTDKIRIIETQWDDSLREGGRVLADETNKAYAALPEDADWAIYIQGDEVLHEDGLAPLQAAMQRWKDDQRVEGLVLRYRHFYGSYEYVADSRRWYRREVRVLRKRPDIFSYKDAQGFRKRPEKKLHVKPVEAFVHHYGWVKEPLKQLQKLEEAHRLWHGDAEWHFDPKQIREGGFNYSEVIDSVALFEHRHPVVMHARIAAQNWTFRHDPRWKKFSWRVKLLMALEKWTGWRIGEFKNYILV
ncbi:MAG: hypothetical protein OHK0053_11810 [Microscillaceae bacterium]